MALPLRAALRSAGRFIAKNPTTMLSMARHALGMRIAVPLDALRWFIANTPPSKKAPQDVTINSKPPAIVLGATVDLMKNPKIRQNDKVRRVLETLTPVVNVSGLSTDGDLLLIQVRATPLGFPRALNAARSLTA